MSYSHLVRAALLCGAATLFPLSAAHAEDDSAAAADQSILVVGRKQAETIDNAPSTKASIDEARIAATVNAVSVEDTIKYLPSLIVRKRHVGDNFAPIATRTSGLGSSARSLIYADGALLSALIANNNGNGSPRWSLVAPEEVEQIDILYGPFSAAYPGNSIGAVVNITTRLPDKLEARASVLTNVQTFDLYGTSEVLPTFQYSGSVGDRFGPLSLFASATRTVSNGQPISFITATGKASTIAGSYPAQNRTGADIAVLGAGGIEHHVQDTFKLKAALDLSDTVRAIYVVGLWRDDSQGRAESYLPSGLTSALSSGIYSRDAEHWSHALTLQGDSKAFDWQVVGTLYDYAHDIQRTPTNVLTGRAGAVQRQDGNGWVTLDAKGAWHIADDAHVLSFGGHFDRYTIGTDTYQTSDWTSNAQGAVTAISRGKTQTAAIWAQDAWRVLPDVTLTLGGRFEWWRAYQGYNQVATLPTGVAQPNRSAHGFSPKASVEWRFDPQWSARLSAGQAFRFPTVGELYQAVATGSVLSNPNPNLLPERAWSEELAVERHDSHGSIRLSLFNESVVNALISQSGTIAVPVSGGGTQTFTTTFVQNVDRTRARGVELAVDQRDILPGWDFSGSVTYADATTRANSGFPASVGKLLPSVPRWKATAVVTWRPDPRVSLTTAARMTSRNYGQLDNSDIVGNTYMGFDKYFVVDVRALVHVTEKVDFALGIDNLTNDKYFLFHPFPQRSFTAQMSWKL
ncbi:MAG TPA: TonB-dependent receptor [Sphingobium sp.]|uniref:TonB-dependent receptor n=1 Tax=Sphingobium sp. TaxID=1912891 RepID=UPI002ED40988